MVICSNVDKNVINNKKLLIVQTLKVEMADEFYFWLVWNLSEFRIQSLQITFKSKLLCKASFFLIF